MLRMQLCIDEWNERAEIPVDKLAPATSALHRPDARNLSFRLLEFLKCKLRYIVATGQTVRWVVQRPVFADLLAPLMVGRTIDVGCGGGTYAIEILAPRSESVLAMDYDYRHASLTKVRAEREGATNVHVLVASANALPFRDHSVDLVFCSEVLEHLPDDNAALREFARVSKPNQTRLLCSVPQPPELFPNPAHLKEGYTPSELTTKLANNGFSAQGVRFCMFGLTKWVLRSCAALTMPIPLLFLCHLERALLLLGVGFSSSSAHDLIILSEYLGENRSSERGLP